MPFNRFITVAWELGGVARQHSVTATGRFMALARDWGRRHGYALPWAWTQECGDWNGAHAHILLHVPARLAPLFRRMPLAWTKRILPAGYVARVLQSQTIRGSNRDGPISATHRENLTRKIAYMLKAAKPEDAALFDLRRYGEECLVFGKRAGAWQLRRFTLK